MKFQFKPTEPPPHIAATNWSDWRWQMRNGLKKADDFSTYFQLNSDEKLMLEQSRDHFQARCTPYYARLIIPTASQDPIRQMVIPTPREQQKGTQQLHDPLGEKQHQPTQRIIHRYPDRVLFLVTDLCSVYCRFCTRKHFTGQDQAFVRDSDYQNAMEYIRGNKGIREVILSGGDPLTLGDGHLHGVLEDLRSIEHIEIIRLGTRMPVVCPMRISQELVTLLRRFAPIFIMTHFNHPRELTFEAAAALGLLVDHGIPVMNQMVLLNGINNHPALVQALSRRLLYLRVKPYYMFQMDPSEGSDHFRTSVENSLSIQRELWGRLSGLALPNLSLDIPGGGGKVGLTPDFVVENSVESWSFRGWDGQQAEYINPPSTNICMPEDVGEYLPEWNAIKNQRYGKTVTKSLSEHTSQ